MAGLVDACSSVDDHPHPDRRRRLASIHSRLQHQPFLSAADRLLDYPRNPPPHSFALAPAGPVAWRAASRQRCADDFAARLFHRLAGKLFHLPLSAGDYRREHSILTAYRVSNCRHLFSDPCGNDCAGIRPKNPANFLQPADSGEPSYLAGHESPWVSGCGLLGQSARPVSSEKGVELEEKREELLSLQDFTEDIIHSMRGGLITTDLAGRVLLLNRTGEEILGHRFAEVRGMKLQQLNDDVWLPGHYENSERLSLRKEIDFRAPSRDVR